MPEILQDSLLIKPWLSDVTRKLPGIQPLDPADWLIRDEAFAAQMAYRDQLIETIRDRVFVHDDRATSASEELLNMVVTGLDKGYEVSTSQILRPDGVMIDFADENLITAARLVQEDLIILQDIDGEYVLTAGVLCFPASWTLQQKFMRSLDIIHKPVASYDSNIAKRVNRMFTAMRPEQPLWRANFLLYHDADLHQPRKETEKRPTGEPQFVRVERQTLRKLPKTKAVVFGIHTYVVPIETLTESERVSLSKCTGENIAVY